MDIKDSVRCMRHCSSDFNIFYVTFLDICPICKQGTNGSFLLVPPFCVPHPFHSNLEAPFSVVVKPTRGCFLNDYKSGDDLHIGITSSKGLVYNYDECGIHIDKDGWSLCVVVNISHIADVTMTSKSNWDDKLSQHSKQMNWTNENYDLSSYNCYNFVLSFLRTVVAPDLHHLLDRDVFCQKFIVPLTTRAGQYIDLRRKILSNGAVVLAANNS